MPGSNKRHQISREDVGILMSYATRPDRITEAWVERLSNGVTHAELKEFSALVGLPQSTAAKLIDVGDRDKTALRGRWPGTGNAYRQAVIGVLAVFVIGVTLIAGSMDRSPLAALAMGSVTAYLVYRLIARLSSG